MIPVSTSEFASQVQTRQARLDQVAESKLRELTQRQSTVDYYQDYDCPRIDTALPISQVQYPKIQPPQQPNIFPSVEAQGQQNEYRNQGYNQSFPGKTQKRSNFHPTILENYPATQPRELNTAEKEGIGSRALADLMKVYWNDSFKTVEY
ncbi:hypothetical protein Golomagni_05004 [Golovinomyces magnicellulatus]|nr:hypothetical protein Golomagni_05004 [Golovinomyces magnicellulatus]